MLCPALSSFALLANVCRGITSRVVAFAAVACALLLSSAAMSSTCHSNIPPSNPDSAYLVHGDGTATDARTGLMWKVCAEGQTWGPAACIGMATGKTWATALSDAESHVFAGHTDWRLPNLKELRSLVEECVHGPSINQTVFPSAPSFDYWSGSPLASVSNSAWSVRFDYGLPGSNIRTSSNVVRLVRGGQSFGNLVNGVCGSAGGLPATTSAAMCSAGTVRTTFGDGSNWVWACEGRGGGTSPSCSAAKQGHNSVDNVLLGAGVTDTCSTCTVAANGSPAYVTDGSLTTARTLNTSTGTFTLSTAAPVKLTRLMIVPKLATAGYVTFRVRTSTQPNSGTITSWNSMTQTTRQWSDSTPEDILIPVDFGTNVRTVEIEFLGGPAPIGLYSVLGFDDTANVTPLTGLGISPYKVQPGQTATLLPLPTTATVGICTSSNTGIATVSGATVTAVNRGQAVITCGTRQIELEVRRPWVQSVSPSTAAPGVFTEFAITGEDLDLVAEVELDGCVGKLSERPGSFVISDTFNPNPITRYFSCTPTQTGNMQLGLKPVNGAQNFADRQSVPVAIRPTVPGCALNAPSGCTVGVMTPGFFVPIESRLNVFAELRDNARYARNGKMLWNELSTPLLMEIQARLRNEGLDVAPSQKLIDARNNAQEQIRQITRQKLEESIGTADGFNWKNWWQSPLKVIGGSAGVLGQYTAGDWAQLSTAVAVNGALAVSDAVGIGNALDAARFAGKSWSQIAAMAPYAESMLQSGDTLLIKAAQRMAASAKLQLVLKGASAGVEVWSDAEKQNLKASVQEFAKAGASAGIPALVTWLSNGAAPSQATDLVRQGIIDFTSATAIDATAAISSSGFSKATKDAIFAAATDAAIGAIPIVGSWVDTYKVGARIAERAVQTAPMFAQADEVIEWSRFQGDLINQQYLALKLALLFDAADKKLGRENLRNPLIATASDLPASWTLQAPGSIERMVLITHGWNAEGSSWPDALVQKMCGRFGATVTREPAAADATIVGISTWCLANGWLVGSYNWNAWAAPTANPDGVIRGPTEALANAHRRGGDMGLQMDGIGLRPKYAHLIGHSAGSGFVESLSAMLKERVAGVRVHSTFLDAYCPTGTGCDYGKTADWAEQYVDRRTVGDGFLELTNAQLEFSYTMDVTDLDTRATYHPLLLSNPLTAPVGLTGDATDFHAFPYRTYLLSGGASANDAQWLARATTVVGVPLSPFYAGLSSITSIDQWLAQKRLDYPASYRCVMRDLTDSATSTTCRGALTKYVPTINASVSVSPGTTWTYCGDSPNGTVTTGAGMTVPTCPPTLPATSLGKASSVGAAAALTAPLTAGIGSGRTEVTTTQSANLVTLSYRFLAGSGSVLARFFVDDQLVHLARLSDNGTNTTTVTKPIPLLAAGTHQVQVVVNTDSTVSASLQLTQIQFLLRSASVDGACGRQNGLASASEPIDLCAAGKPSAVASGGTWTWTCGGTGSGATSASCVAAQPVCRLDVDGDGRVDPATDGVLLMRHMMGFKGPALTQGLTLNGPRSSYQRIQEFLSPKEHLDVFFRFPSGNAAVAALPTATQDGLVLLRKTFGFSGSWDWLFGGFRSVDSSWYFLPADVSAHVDRMCGAALPVATVPRIITVVPSASILGQNQMVYVRGENLPSTLIVNVSDQIVGCSRSSWTPSFASFTCPMSVAGNGKLLSVQTDRLANGGQVLATYPFDVVGTTTPMPSVTINTDQASLTALGAVFPAAGSFSFVSGNAGRSAVKFNGVANPAAIRIPNTAAMQFTTGATFDFWARIDSDTGMNGFGQSATSGWAMALLSKSHDSGSASINAFSPDLSYAGSGYGFGAWASSVAGWGTGPCTIAVRNPGDALGAWFRITAVASTTTGTRIYHNKQLIYSCPSAVPNFTGMNAQDLYIGKYRDTWYPLNGAVQDIRIYQQALTDAEVQALP